jgi:hypothetical protein
MKLSHLFLTLVIVMVTACSGPRTDPGDLINKGASPPGGLPFDPLQWRIITSSINRHDSTMSTLYGNDLAVNHARTLDQPAYPSGSVLSLVTWVQKDDERWYGARIPGSIQSIEFVQVELSQNGQSANTYQDYEGAPLQKMPDKDAATISARVTDILDRKASVMP